MRILIYTFCSIVDLYEVKIGSVVVVIAIKDGISSVEGHRQTVSRFGAASQSCPDHQEIVKALVFLVRSDHVVDP